jgi:ElaB/YqjD/DUF883 family membrane-anchored ribosome-binding protein
MRVRHAITTAPGPRLPAGSRPALFFSLEEFAMNESITDPTDDFTGTTAIAPTTSGLGTGAGSAARTGTQDRPAAAGSASDSSAAMRDRVHRVASAVHQAIDRMEQTLSAKGQGVASTQSAYRERATQYGEQLRSQGDRMREQVDAKPLQAIGLSVVAGLVFGKLFMRSPRVAPARPYVVQRRPVVEVDAGDRPARRWMDSAGASMRNLRDTGQIRAAEASAEAGARMERARAMTAALAQAAVDRASSLPVQLRLAAERLRTGSRAYGSVAKSTVQAHPMVGAGTALGGAALLATLWLRRRQATDSAYIAVDAKGHGVAWKHADDVGRGVRAREMISSRPVTSAAVALGIGALAAALLRRR